MYSARLSEHTWQLAASLVDQDVGSAETVDELEIKNDGRNVISKQYDQ